MQCPMRRGIVLNLDVRAVEGVGAIIRDGTDDVTPGGGCAAGSAHDFFSGKFQRVIYVVECTAQAKQI